MHACLTVAWALVCVCVLQVTFVGKFADWKRLDALLSAAAIYEKEIAARGEKIITIIAGSGPLESQKLYMDMPAK